MDTLTHNKDTLAHAPIHVIIVERGSCETCNVRAPQAWTVEVS